MNNTTRSREFKKEKKRQYKADHPNDPISEALDRAIKIMGDAHLDLERQLRTGYCRRADKPVKYEYIDNSTATSSGEIKLEEPKYNFITRLIRKILK